MKKEKGALVGAARRPLPPTFPVVGEDARARFRFHTLMQEYEELLKETATKRRRSQMGRQRVHSLSNEVKFLRRRYKYLIKNSSSTPHMVKTVSQKTSTAVEHKVKRNPAALDTQHRNGKCVNYGQHSQHDSRCKDKEPVVPSTSAIIDLNKILLPDGEEGGFHVAWDPVPMEVSLKRYVPKEDMSGSEPKSSACHGIETGHKGAGKRKNSWQDLVALKV